MIIVMLIVLGLCMGSFVNALVWRLHKQQEQSNAKSPKLKKAKNSSLSILNGRSMCPSCRHALAWYDLIPVLSWFSLKAKCRYCHKPISWQYPAVELLTASLFVASYVFWPQTLALYSEAFLFAFWLIFVTGFIALAIYDLRWMILPDRIVFPLQFLAVIYALLTILVLQKGLSGLLAAFLAVLSSAGLFYVLFQISKGKWIGGGDVKLAVVLGLVLGDPIKVFMMLFIASLLGTCISLPLLMIGKFNRTSKLPFGPLLIIGTTIVYLFGSHLIDWYKQYVLLA